MRSSGYSSVKDSKQDDDCCGGCLSGMGSSSSGGYRSSSSAYQSGHTTFNSSSSSASAGVSHREHGTTIITGVSVSSGPNSQNMGGSGGFQGSNTLHPRKRG